MDDEQRIRELEAQVASLAAEVRALRSATAPPAGAVVAAPSVAQQPVTSRRNVLKLVGAAAAGSAAALAVRAGTVAAADGAPIQIGNENVYDNDSRDTTVLRYPNLLGPQVGPSTANLFLVRDDPSSNDTSFSASPTYPAAIGGYAFRAVPNGLYGYTQGTGYGVVARGAGSASIGLYAIGAKANLQLRAEGEVPSKRVDAHSIGEITMDVNNDVWICIAAGTPGTWRKLSGPASAGAFHALAPSRVYDSRVAQPAIGSLSTGQSRLISVASKRDTATGAVTQADIVPVGATAIAVNVTVVNTSAGGFVTVNPGGTTSVEGATVNWSASGQILNNGVIVKLDGSRQVTAVVGGTSTTKTDIVLDVTGYFL